MKKRYNNDDGSSFEYSAGRYRNIKNYQMSSILKRFSIIFSIKSFRSSFVINNRRRLFQFRSFKLCEHDAIDKFVFSMTIVLERIRKCKFKFIVYVSHCTCRQHDFTCVTEIYFLFNNTSLPLILKPK